MIYTNSWRKKGIPERRKLKINIFIKRDKIESGLKNKEQGYRSSKNCKKIVR